MASIDDRVAHRETRFHDTNDELQSHAAKQQSAQRLQLADLFDKAVARVSARQEPPPTAPADGRRDQSGDPIRAQVRASGAPRQPLWNVAPEPAPSRATLQPAPQPVTQPVTQQSKRTAEPGESAGQTTDPAAVVLAPNIATAERAAPVVSAAPAARSVDLGRFDTLAALSRHLEQMQALSSDAVYRLELLQPGGTRLALEFRGAQPGEWRLAIQGGAPQAGNADLSELRRRLERQGLRIAAIDIDEALA